MLYKYSLKKTLQMNLKSYPILFIFILFSVWSCAPSPKTEEKEAPKIEGFNTENGKYYNSKLGLEISLPKEWFVLDDEQIEKIHTAALTEMLKEDSTLKETMDASKANTDYLLQAFKYKPNEQVNYNPDITIFVENIEKNPDIKRATDYLAYVQKTIGYSKSNFIEQSFTLKTISNRDFYFIELSQQSSKGITFTSKIHALIIDRTALVVTVSYSSEEEKREIDKILETMKFEK